MFNTSLMDLPVTKTEDEDHTLSQTSMDQQDNTMQDKLTAQVTQETVIAPVK